MQIPPTPQPISRGRQIVAEYQQIEQDVLAGKDRFTISANGVEKDVTLLAATGKHPAMFPRGGSKYHYAEIKAIEQTPGDPKSTVATTYDLGSADGVDNILSVHTPREDVTLDYPWGFIMSDQTK